MKPTSRNRMQSFYRKLRNAGISVNIRTQFGSDINAACGQLAGTYQDEEENTTLPAPDKNSDKPPQKQ